MRARRRPLPSSGGEALAALAPAALDDRAAAAGTHPGTEPVGPGPLALLWLVGALHGRPAQYTDALGEPAARDLFSGICERSAARGRRMVGASATAAVGQPRAGSDGRATGASRPPRAGRRGLWSRASSDAACGRSVPESTFQLWLEPLRPVGVRGATLYLAAPDGIRTWVERRYAALIADALSRGRRAAHRGQLRAPARGERRRSAPTKRSTSTPTTPSTAS